MLTNQQIIEAAKALNAAIEANDEAAIDKAYDRPEAREPLVMVAMKLLAGRPYGIYSDNPETHARARALAKDMGAIVVEDESWGTVGIRILPPTRH
jgi:hypothetical protein